MTYNDWKQYLTTKYDSKYYKNIIQFRGEILQDIHKRTQVEVAKDLQISQAQLSTINKMLQEIVNGLY